MIRYLLCLGVLLFSFLASPLALAQPTPEASPAPAVTPIPETADPSAVLPLLARFVEAAQRKDYALAGGLALMIVTFLAIRFGKDRVPKDYMATLLLGCSVFGGFGAALVSGIPPAKAAWTFLVFSALAIAFWEGVGKIVYRLWQKYTSADAGGGA